ncbi:hypothetical protein D9756_007806 [Leucocoprinus leucothites]|uniref:Uncharacterized protein n=1 Tax=Leucocoprinus leucothites TaxID=201217 RepID=A0A8H5FYF1_9AGAR|nr:hypothetical protein D9756_007806 [Leucoagaricus leucothites]
MSNSFSAMIEPVPTPLDVQSKYTIEGFWVDGGTGVNQIWTFNVNADVAVPKFYSPGAQQGMYSLSGTKPNGFESMVGYDTFTGSVGGGRFYIRTRKGVIIKGPIVGGTREGVSFVGSGTWMKS